ncbi:unnamed protein product [Phyllotreta striolata]|uniref:Uncharacterized protein n=1 Tax=Phyllotreta striolata TaxID=444603 RepID=A0A9N9XTA1_PHYSR|nr:unnamed protein product [Phyllotreta striolata]
MLLYGGWEEMCLPRHGALDGPHHQQPGEQDRPGSKRKHVKIPPLKQHQENTETLSPALPASLSYFSLTFFRRFQRAGPSADRGGS